MTSLSTRKRQRKPAKRKPAASIAKSSRGIKKAGLQWRDVLLEISYEREWMGMKDGVAHLQIHVMSPKGAIIPVTDTGYRSHFISSIAVDGAGGPAAYVQSWLESEAAAPSWKKREIASRQLRLL